MATQKQVFTEAKNGLDSANHTTSGLIEYLRYIFGKLENASGGGGGGSEVSYTQTLASGTETGTIEIDGVSTKMYAPTPTAPTEVEVTQVISTGTKIATISVDDVPTDIYAPAGGGSGVTTVSVTADGVKTYSQLLDDLYALISSASIHMGSLHIASKYIPITVITTGLVRCAGFSQMSTSSLDMYIAILQASSSSYKNIYGVGSLTENDISSNVPTSGDVIEISYI